MIDVARVGDHAEIAKVRRKSGFGYAANVSLMLHAVANQIRDREHFQIVFVAEFTKLRHARHRAVLAHDFADDACGLQAGDASEVYTGFGLTCANKDAAVARPKREDVAGTREVLRLCFRINSGEDGDGAVGSANAGG